MIGGGEYSVIHLRSACVRFPVKVIIETSKELDEGICGENKIAYSE